MDTPRVMDIKRTQKIESERLFFMNFDFIEIIFDTSQIIINFNKYLNLVKKEISHYSYYKEHNHQRKSLFQ